MIQLTPYLYTSLDLIASVEAFPITLCIKITLKNDQVFERFISEEKIADYADPDGQRITQYREQQVLIYRQLNTYGSGVNIDYSKPLIDQWPKMQKEYGIVDLAPMGREAAVANELHELVRGWEQHEQKVSEFVTKVRGML